MTDPPTGVRVRHHRLHFFTREALKRVRLPTLLASQTADALVAANLVGSDEDGVAWLPELINGISTRHLNPEPRMRVVASSGAVAVLDGDNAPGPAVAHRAMMEAAALAKAHGVGAVAVRRSNRPGAMGHFAGLALHNKMAGLAVTTGPPAPVAETVLPAAAPVRFGCAIPLAETAPPLRLDLDLSGDEDDAGLGLALETLVLFGGSALASEMVAATRPEPLHHGVGHLFLAFRVRAFAPWAGFRNRMVERLEHLRRARTEWPGQRAAEIEEGRRTFGIPLEAETAADLEQLSRRFDLGAEWRRLVSSARRS